MHRNRRIHVAGTNLQIGEDLMNSVDYRWNVPVCIRIGEGPPEFIHGPVEALAHLQDRWPAVRGSHYQSAMRNCVDAKSQLGPLDPSRESFVAAAIEADVLA